MPVIYDDSNNRIVYDDETGLGSDMSGPEKFLTGIGAGMYDVYKGTQVLGAKVGKWFGAVSPETVAGLEQERSEARAAFSPLTEVQYHPSLGNPASAGYLTGQTVPFIPMGGGTTGGLLRRMATGGAAGATQGAISDTDQGRGAVMGGLLGAGFTGGLYALQKAGEVAGAARGTTDLSQLADRYRIPITYAERRGAPRMGVYETLAEKAPLSTMVMFRKQQQEAANDAANRLLGQYIVDRTAGDVMGANRQFSSQLFENVKDMLPDTVAIQPAKVRTAAARLLDEYPDIFKTLQDTKTERVIKDIVKGTEGKSGLSNVGTVEYVPKTLTFEEAWTLRQGLGDLIGQLRKKVGRGDINKTALSRFSELFGSVSDDMESWATSIGRKDIMSAFNSANEAYKQYVMRYDMMQRAYDAAVDATGNFSPQKYSTALKKLADKSKYTKNFTDDQIGEMTGLAHIMSVIKRAGQYGENVPTGNRAVDFGMAIPAVGVKAIPAGWALTYLTTTKNGQSLLMAASKAAPGSAALGKIMSTLYRTVPKFAVGAASGAYPVAPAE